MTSELGEFNVWSIGFSLVFPYQILHWHKQAHFLLEELYFYLHTKSYCKNSQKFALYELCVWNQDLSKTRKHRIYFFFNYVNNTKNNYF